MSNFLCKVFGHKFKYIRRYYRCTRCGVRRCDLFARETDFVSKSTNYSLVNTSDSNFGRVDTSWTPTLGTGIAKELDKEIK